MWSRILIHVEKISQIQTAGEWNMVKKILNSLNCWLKASKWHLETFYYHLKGNFGGYKFSTEQTFVRFIVSICDLEQVF